MKRYLQLLESDSITEQDVNIRISLDEGGFSVLCDYANGQTADEYVLVNLKGEAL